MICRRVYTVLLMIAAPLEGSTTFALKRSKVYTVLYITATFLRGIRPLRPCIEGSTPFYISPPQLAHGTTPPAMKSRVITAPLVWRTTPHALICRKLSTILYITAAVVQGTTPLRCYIEGSAPVYNSRYTCSEDYTPLCDV